LTERPFLSKQNRKKEKKKRLKDMITIFFPSFSKTLFSENKFSKFFSKKNNFPEKISREEIIFPPQKNLILKGKIAQQ